MKHSSEMKSKTEKKKGKGKMQKFQASPGLSRYGKAGPPVQHSNERYITPKELKARIKELNLKPEDLYTKEKILEDPKVKEYLENLVLNEEIEREVKADEEDSMIPGDEPKKKDDQKKPNPDDEFIPDNEPGNNEDMIPD